MATSEQCESEIQRLRAEERQWPSAGSDSKASRSSLSCRSSLRAEPVVAVGSAWTAMSASLASANAGDPLLPAEENIAGRLCPA